MCFRTCTEFLDITGCEVGLALDQFTKDTLLGIQMDEDSDHWGRVENACLLAHEKSDENRFFCDNIMTVFLSCNPFLQLLLYGYCND